jgi:phage terminase small subunit
MKKLTEKQELFCRAFIETGEKVTAYKMAYNAENMKAPVITVKSCELASLPHVAARIDELREAARERNKITVDTLLAELEENRQAALNAETPQAAAATSATMGKAKLLGLDKQIIEHTGPGGSALTPTVIQLVGPADDNSEA